MRYITPRFIAEDPFRLFKEHVHLTHNYRRSTDGCGCGRVDLRANLLTAYNNLKSITFDMSKGWDYYNWRSVYFRKKHKPSFDIKSIIVADTEWQMKLKCLSRASKAGITKVIFVISNLSTGDFQQALSENMGEVSRCLGLPGKYEVGYRDGAKLSIWTFEDPSGELFGK